MLIIFFLYGTQFFLRTVIQQQFKMSSRFKKGPRVSVLSQLSTVFTVFYFSSQMPVDITTLSEEERKLRMRKREPKRASKQKLDDFEEDFNVDDYSKFWKKNNGLIQLNASLRVFMLSHMYNIAMLFYMSPCK